MKNINIGSAYLQFESSVAQKLNDDILLSLGTDGDNVFLNRSTVLNANTSLTGVLIGTPVAQAIAANSLMISNVTASGDVAIYTNLGGNSQMVFWADGSAGDTAVMAASGGSVDFYQAGVKFIDFTNNGTTTALTGLAGDYIALGSQTTSNSLNTNADLVVDKLEANGILYGDSGFNVTGAISTSQGCYFSKNWTSVVAETFGFQVVYTYRETSANNANIWHEIYVQPDMLSGNNKNWTASPIGISGYTCTQAIDSGATGTVTGAASFWVKAPAIAAATITNLYGLYVGNAAGAGTVTNQYGVYFESLTKGGTLNYMIHGAADITVGMGINIAATKTYQVAGTQVVGARVIDDRINDTVNTTLWDATTAGVLLAIQAALQTHGLIAAA